MRLDTTFSSQMFEATVAMSEDSEFNKRFAEDLLLGAEAISTHLNSLGFPINEDGVYYAHRVQTWPISKHGKFLIATRSGLTRHAKKITSLSTT
jgi:hypothetical protein